MNVVVVVAVVVVVIVVVFSSSGSSWPGQFSRYSDWLSGIESRLGRDFPPVQAGPAARTSSYKMGTGSFPGVKWGRDSVMEELELYLYPHSGSHRVNRSTISKY